jgi:hypothetical protein
VSLLFTAHLILNIAPLKLSVKISVHTARGRGDLGWPKFTLVPSNFNKLSKQVTDFSYLIRYLLHIFSAGGCYQLQVGEYTQARHSSDSEVLSWLGGFSTDF